MLGSAQGILDSKISLRVFSERSALSQMSSFASRQAPHQEQGFVASKPHVGMKLSMTDTALF